MTENLGELKVQIGADTTKLEGAGRKVSTILNGIGGQMVSIGKTAAIAGAAISAAFMVVLKKTADVGDEINDLSQRTGIATEILSGYKLAADKSGTSIEGFATGMRGLAKAMNAAQDPTSSQAQAFKAIGVSVTDAAGKIRPLNDVMLDAAERFSQMEDGERKLNLAMEIFGKSGMALIPMLNMGKKGLEENYEATKRLGGLWSKEAAEAADAFNDSISELKLGIGSMLKDALVAVMPIMQRLTETMTTGFAKVREQISKLAESGKIKAWAIEIARVFIGAFKIIAQAIGGLAESFYFLQGVVFSIGEGIIREVTRWYTWVAGTVAMMSKVVPGMKGIAKDMAGAWKDLIVVGMSYHEQADKNYEKTTDLVSVFEQLNGFLNKLSASLDNTSLKTEKVGKSLASAGAAVGAALAPMTKFGDLVKSAPAALEGMEYGTEQVGKTTADTTQAVEDDWTRCTQSMAESFGNAFAEIIRIGGSLSSFFTSLMQGISNSIATYIGSVISKQITTLLDKVSKSVGTLGTLGIAGAALGIVSLLAGVFKKKPKKTEEQRQAEELAGRVKDIKNIASEFGKISDTLAQTLAEESKTLGQAIAVHKNFGDVIRDVGIKQANINKLWWHATDVLEDYKNGALDLEDTQESLGESFTALLEGAKKLGQEGSAAMVDFIKKVRESGVEVAEVTEYVQDQLGKIPDALSTLLAPSTEAAEKIKELKEQLKDQREELKGLKEGSKEYIKLQNEIAKTEEAIRKQNIALAMTKPELERLGIIALASFNSLIASGMSWTEAMAQMSEPLSQLRDRYRELGIDGGAALNQLLRLAGITEANKALFNSIDANKQILEALGNTGFLTAESLLAISKNATAYYFRLKKTGMTSKEALTAMAPSLQEIYDYAKKYGIELDKGTQYLIDQALQQGLIKEDNKSEKDIWEDISATMKDVRDIMKDFLKQMRGTSDEGR